MGGWMDGWINDWIESSMDGSMVGWVDDGQTDVSVIGQVD